MKFPYSLAAALLTISGAAHANETVYMQVGYSPGGSYDQMTRLVAEFLPDHLEGSPEVVVENVPGAGSLKLARMIMQDDGQEMKLASVSSALALRPIFEPDKTDFDPREVTYIASMTHASSYCVAHKNSGITSLQQFLDDPDAKVGATGKGSTTYLFPAAIKAASGGKFEVVSGFKGGSEINLAMERGDIDVRCGINGRAATTGSLADSITIIAEMGTEPSGEFDGVAFALDYALEGNREALSLVFSSTRVHRPYIVSPNVDDATVAMLRDAFTSLAADPAFLQAAEERDIVVSFTDGAETWSLIEGYLAQPEEVQSKARAFAQ